MKYKNIRYPAFLEEPFKFPDFYRIEIEFDRPRLDDLGDAIRRELQPQFDKLSIEAGQTVGIGIGSRGIANIAKIARIICQEIAGIGAKPVIIPAMGSHGGATAEGQRAALGTFGITEAELKAPVRPSMAVERIAAVFSEVPVFYSAEALKCDHTICVNRIKPHTKFKAPIESGVLKMLCVGMGKHEGALAYHKWALKYGFFPLLKEMGEAALKYSNFRFGVAIVENAYDETMHIQAIAADILFKEEERLQSLAKENMPRLPVKEADVLVLLEMGKEISGAGMDPNITGRAVDLKEDDFSGMFKATRLAVLKLSDASKGNALGIGAADVIAARMFECLDYETTLMNILTGNSLKKAAIPVIMPNDQKVIQTCHTTLGPIEPENVKTLIVRNTLHLSECWASEALLNEIKKNPRAIVKEKTRLEFDAQGNLINLIS